MNQEGQYRNQQEASYRVMCRKKTTEEFIEEARRVHGDRYDYSEAVYSVASEKVTILCKKHGPFRQSARKHTLGRGCPKCGRESVDKSLSKRSSKAASEFVAKSISVHGDRYDYSCSLYSNIKSKVKIVCRIHGLFEMLPNNHIVHRQGCPACGKESRAAINLKKAIDKHKAFASKARAVHGNTYDYAKVVYKNSTSKVTITCSKHGDFDQLPGSHLRGIGCPACGLEGPLIANQLASKKAALEFTRKADLVHQGKYDYKCVIYEKCSNKVKIICKKHGPFLQTPNEHLAGSGCPKCKSSRMERRAHAVLSDIGIDFDSNTPMFKRMRFDIAIAKFRQLWEFDGEQHFVPVKIWGGEDALIKSIERDAEKTRWAVENNWAMIRVPYWDQGNIESYIREYTAAPPPPGLIITSHRNGEYSYDKMLEVAGVTDLPYMASLEKI